MIESRKMLLSLVLFTCLVTRISSGIVEKPEKESRKLDSAPELTRYSGEAGQETFETAATVKQKRCPSSNRVGASFNLGQEVVGAPAPPPIERRDLQGQINKRLCENCLSRPNCKIRGSCELCATWCNPKSNQSSKGPIEAGPEEAPVPQEISIGARSNMVEGHEPIVGSPLGAQPTNNMITEKPIYNVATLQTGSIKDTISRLFVLHPEDVDTVGLWVTTFSNTSPTVSETNPKEIHCEGSQEQVKVNNEQLVEAVKQNIKEALDNKIKKLGNNVISPEEADRLIGETIDGVQLSDLDRRKPEELAPVVRSGIGDVLPRYPITSGFLVPQTVNPAIIEGTPDMARLGSKQDEAGQGNFVGAPINADPRQETGQPPSDILNQSSTQDRNVDDIESVVTPPEMKSKIGDILMNHRDGTPQDKISPANPNVVSESAPQMGDDMSSVASDTSEIATPITGKRLREFMENMKNTLERSNMNRVGDKFRDMKGNIDGINDNVNPAIQQDKTVSLPAGGDPGILQQNANLADSESISKDIQPSASNVEAATLQPDELGDDNPSARTHKLIQKLKAKKLMDQQGYNPQGHYRSSETESEDIMRDRHLKENVRSEDNLGGQQVENTDDLGGDPQHPGSRTHKLIQKLKAKKGQEGYSPKGGYSPQGYHRSSDPELSSPIRDNLEYLGNDDANLGKPLKHPDEENVSPANEPDKILTQSTAGDPGILQANANLAESEPKSKDIQPAASNFGTATVQMLHPEEFDDENPGARTHKLIQKLKAKKLMDPQKYNPQGYYRASEAGSEDIIGDPHIEENVRSEGNVGEQVELTDDHEEDPEHHGSRTHKLIQKLKAKKGQAYSPQGAYSPQDSHPSQGYHRSSDPELRLSEPNHSEIIGNDDGNLENRQAHPAEERDDKFENPELRTHTLIQKLKAKKLKDDQYPQGYHRSSEPDLGSSHLDDALEESEHGDHMKDDEEVENPGASMQADSYPQYRSRSGSPDAELESSHPQEETEDINALEDDNMHNDSQLGNPHDESDRDVSHGDPRTNNKLQDAGEDGSDNGNQQSDNNFGDSGRITDEERANHDAENNDSHLGAEHKPTGPLDHELEEPEARTHGLKKKLLAKKVKPKQYSQTYHRSNDPESEDVRSNLNTEHDRFSEVSDIRAEAHGLNADDRDRYEAGIPPELKDGEFAEPADDDDAELASPKSEDVNDQPNDAPQGPTPDAEAEEPLSQAEENVLDNNDITQQRQDVRSNDVPQTIKGSSSPPSTASKILHNLEDVPQYLLHTAEKTINAIEDENREQKQDETVGSQPLENSWELIHPPLTRSDRPNTRVSNTENILGSPMSHETLRPNEDNGIVDLENRSKFDKHPNPSWSNSLGSIIPVQNEIDMSLKHPNEIYFIGNGIKLPLHMVKKDDGAVHLSVDIDKLCSCKNISCPKNHAIIEETVGTILEKEAELKDQLAPMDEPQEQDFGDLPLAMASPVIEHDASAESTSDNDDELKNNLAAIDAPQEEKQIADEQLAMASPLLHEDTSLRDEEPHRNERDLDNLITKYAEHQKENLETLKRSAGDDATIQQTNDHPKATVDSTTAASNLAVPTDIFQKLMETATQVPIPTTTMFKFDLLPTPESTPNYFQDFINKRITDIKTRMSDLGKQGNVLSTQFFTPPDILKNLFGGASTEPVTPITPPTLPTSIPTITATTSATSTMPTTTEPIGTKIKKFFNRGGEKFDELLPIRKQGSVEGLQNQLSKLAKLSESVDQYSKKNEEMAMKGADTLTKTSQDGIIQQEVGLMNNFLNWLKGMATQKRK